MFIVAFVIGAFCRLCNKRMLDWIKCLSIASLLSKVERSKVKVTDAKIPKSFLA